MRTAGAPQHRSDAVPSPPPAVQRQPTGTDAGPPAGDSPLRGMIVHDDPAAQRALGVIMQRCGFQLAGATEEPHDWVGVARATRPDAIVIDLALTGDLGLQIITAFLRVSPACMMVVLSPFTTLDAQARELGAMSVVDPRDLRHVEDWLLLGIDPEHPCRC